MCVCMHVYVCIHDTSYVYLRTRRRRHSLVHIHHPVLKLRFSTERLC